MTNTNNTPATYGGHNWQPRPQSLREEIGTGEVWHRCGYQSESAVLREVLLSWPGEELDFSAPPDTFLMLARPDLTVIRQQTEKIAAFYESQGITVHLARPATLPPPNFLFQRDLFWATRNGIVLARPASRQRAGEERYTAETLAAIGVPIVKYFTGTATFEAADALWLDPKTVLLGLGVRTNQQAARQLRYFLKAQGVDLLETKLPAGCQHLLGIINFINTRQAVVRGAMLSGELQDILTKQGIKMIKLPDDNEMRRGLGMNFVTLAPGRIVMPAGSPGIRNVLTDNGIAVHEIEISEYLKAAGGLACLTGILRREELGGG